MIIGPDQRYTFLKTGVFLNPGKRSIDHNSTRIKVTRPAGVGKYLAHSQYLILMGESAPDQMSENTRSKMGAGINHVRRVRE